MEPVRLINGQPAAVEPYCHHDLVLQVAHPPVDEGGPPLPVRPAELAGCYNEADLLAQFANSGLEMRLTGIDAAAG
jgi:hypothetical protein